MKVGLVTAFLGNLRAGTWTYASRLLRELAPLCDVWAIEREERILAELSGVPTKVYPGGGGKIGKLVWPNLILPDRAAADGFDLVHAPNPFGTFRRTACRNVITIHDVTPLLFPGTHERTNVLYHRHLLPAVLKRADRVITVSESSRRDIVRCFGLAEEKIAVVSNGVDPAFLPDPVGEPGETVRSLPRPYILHVGTLEPRKNLELLIRSFALARRRGLDHYLVLAGMRGWGGSRLEAVAAELGVAEALILAGYVPHDDIPHLYAGADFFVYPSLYEGFGLPPLEAMACGVPVITSDTSSLPEVTGDAALLVDPRSEGEVADAMLKLAGDVALRRELREKGLVQARRFTWRRAAEATLAVYREVLGG